MPDDHNRSNWPELLKYSPDFRHLFPRNEVRDLELETILADCIPAKYDAHLEGDLVEASRRLREAIQHDAYLRWTPADKKVLAKVFASLEEALFSLQHLTSHQHKAILLSTIADGQIESNLDSLRDRIKATFEKRVTITEKLEELQIEQNGHRTIRPTTDRTATRPFSLIQRMIEAWEVMSGQIPSTTFSNNDSEAGPFERCLQEVGDHLGLQTYNNDRIFRARSALQAFKKKPPPPDNV